MKKHLLTVLHYFGYFYYAPSFDEIYTFFPQKITKKSLVKHITQEVQNKKVLRLSNNMGNSIFRLSHSSTNRQLLTANLLRYTLPQYSMLAKSNPKLKCQISNKSAIGTIQRYISLLDWCPFIQFVGVTGKSAMRGVRNNDDLDLCIVTKSSQLWTTRIYAVVIAKLLGIHGDTGICLNLFFDEADLIIPKKKQNSYIAHEILQMKPIIDKACLYGRFLSENRWISRYFPNANIAKRGVCSAERIGTLPVTRYPLHEKIDAFFKSLQLPIIRHNRTAFYITPTQLWLFKKDFEKKLKRAGLVL